MADGCVDVVIKAVEDIHEVTVRVPVRCTLSEVKLALAQEINRPEVMEQGKFLMTMANGDHKAILETQKLGPRRNLLFIGAPLYPPPEELPPATIEDFDPYDQEQLIESPRTLKACEAEGVDPEELFYVPLENYLQRGLPKRTARLRHDFFEAFRQDTVEIVKRARNLIKGEEELPWSTSVTAYGGNWGGALSPQQYEMTHMIFQDLNAMLTVDKVYERPKEQLPFKGKAPSGNRWSPGGSTQWFVDTDRPHHIFSSLALKDADLSTPNVEAQSEDVEDRLARLKKLPAGNREQVAGVPLRSENIVCSQLEENSRKMRRAHRERREVVKKQVAIAEVQCDLVDRHLEDVEIMKEHRENVNKTCMAPWKTPLQQSNSDAAGKREETWQDRRYAVHMSQLDAEAARRDKMQSLAHRDLERQRRVANMQDLAKIHFAKTWADRRTAWGLNHQAVAKGMDTFNKMTLHKHAEANARVEDQRRRMQSYIDYKREFKALRKALTDIAAEREQKRHHYRRQAVADELLQMSEDAKSSTSRTMLGSPSRGSLRASSQRPSPKSMTCSSSPSLHTGVDPLSPTRGRFPRFDWGRFGAESVSSPSRTAGGGSSPGSFGGNSPKSKASTMRRTSSDSVMGTTMHMLRANLG